MADSYRQDENVLSIYIYKLNTQKRIENLVIPDDIREGICLKTVTSVKIDCENQYDEGDTRIVRKDILVSIEAIVNQTSVTTLDTFREIHGVSSNKESTFAGSNITGPVTSNILRGGNKLNNTNLDTNGLIAYLHSFLSCQGVVIDLSNYPGQMRNIVPSKSSSPIPKGWLVDTYNGPKPLSLQIQSLPGGNDFRIVWKVKYSIGPRESYELYDLDTAAKYDISSEMRLDIDEESDLQIIISGTIYGTTPADLFLARRQLQFEISNKSTKINVLGDDEKVKTIDTYTQFNGFLRKTTFDIEKNGRTAKFSITFTQIKSNSAFPYGIRKIDFKHTVQSTLFGDAMQGAGMVSWLNTFNGKIRIPNRFHAAYAWYILWYLIAQRTRKLKSFTIDKTSKKSAASQITGAINKAATDDETETRNTIKAICTKVKLTNDVFNRELSFDLDYLVVCPLNYVFSATCFFERLNNDYHRRYSMPITEDGQLNKDYRPEKLSTQWDKWLDSTRPNFDPTIPSNKSQALSNMLYDGSGIEITESASEINPFEKHEGRYDTDLQRHSFVTLIADRYEKDPDYKNENVDIDTPVESYTMPNPSKITSEKVATTRFIKNTETNQTLKDSTDPQLAENVNTDESFLEIIDDTIDPRFSWIKFEEEYHVSETHPTIPVEGLNGADVAWHGEEKLYRQFVNNPETNVFDNLNAVAPPDIPSSIPDPAAETEHRLASGMYANAGATDPNNPEALLVDYDPNHPESQNPMIRKTYALKGSRYFVTVKGRAIRAQYPISIPTVISIAGAPAIKVGTGRSMLKPMGLQGSTPIYAASWEQTYTVDKSLLNEDILTKIESTGSSILYT
jgi:hypothetical protein